jgi:hypothetical protein
MRTAVLDGKSSAEIARDLLAHSATVTLGRALPALAVAEASAP